jgi:hypothetical protein
MPINLQVVDIGSAPNDETGDPGRDAFDKVNDNSALIEAAIEDAERKAYVVPITGEEDAVDPGKFVKFRLPYAFVLLEVRASLNSAESGVDVEVSISSGGGTIFNTGDELIIPAGTTTSLAASPQPDVRYVVLNDNDEILMTVASGATGGTATGLKVYLIGYVIWATF